MLRPTCTNISIITNFGCKNKCWFCIYRNHPLAKTKGPYDFNGIKRFLESNKNKGKVSISGGGDPLYDFENNQDWWSELFKITDKINMKVDIHTREKLINYDFWNKINRCVFSSTSFEEDEKYLRYILSMTKLRITHLVTADTTFGCIKKYQSFINVNQYRCQFTIKQLVGFDDKGMYSLIKKRYPEIFYLDTGDYNVYYMPDNSIRNKWD